MLAAESRTVIGRRHLPAAAVVGHGQVPLSGERRDVSNDDVTSLWDGDRTMLVCDAIARAAG